MTATHVHLLITHLPIFASLFGGFVLAWGIVTKSTPTKYAAYVILVISAIGAAIANATGEAAEETVEHLPGVLHTAIHTHEEAAELAFIAQVVLGVFALLSFFLTMRRSGFSRLLAMVTLLVALVSFGLVARTGYLGGMIRHTEIADPQAGQPEPPAGEEHK